MQFKKGAAVQFHFLLLNHLVYNLNFFYDDEKRITKHGSSSKKKKEKKTWKKIDNSPCSNYYI